MKMMHTVVFALLSPVLLPKAAQAYPEIRDPRVLRALGGLEKFSPILWDYGVNDPDTDALRFPYDQLSIDGADSRLNFSFTYNATGGLISTLIHPSFSSNLLDKISESGRSPFDAPLKATSTAWHLFRAGKTADMTIASFHAAATDIPTFASAIPFQFNRDALAKLAEGLKTGDNVGIAYAYNFQAVSPGFTLKVNANWPKFDAFVLAQGPSDYQSFQNIRFLTEQAVKKGIVKFSVANTQDSSFSSKDLAITELAQFISKLRFVPLHAAAETSTEDCAIDGDPLLIKEWKSSCTGDAIAFRFQPLAAGAADAISSYVYNVERLRVVHAQATGIFNGFCNKSAYAANFINSETAERGCPTEVLPSKITSSKRVPGVNNLRFDNIVVE